MKANGALTRRVTFFCNRRDARRREDDDDGRRCVEREMRALVYVCVRECVCDELDGVCVDVTTTGDETEARAHTSSASAMATARDKISKGSTPWTTSTVCGQESVIQKFVKPWPPAPVEVKRFQESLGKTPWVA